MSKVNYKVGDVVHILPNIDKEREEGGWTSFPLLEVFSSNYTTIPFIITEKDINGSCIRLNTYDRTFLSQLLSHPYMSNRHKRGMESFLIPVTALKPGYNPKSKLLFKLLTYY